jgi:hypothetical protein
MIRKHRLNESSSSTTNIETGNNQDLTSLPPNQSHQLVTSTNDTNTEISMNVLLSKEKPNIGLQTQAAKKRQRAGTGLVFNEDI